MLRTAILLAALAGSVALTTGCTSVSYEGPNNTHFKRTAFMTRASAGEIEVQPQTNGLPLVRIKALQSDSATAAIEASERTANAIARGLSGH